jgi:hypothetical protein
LDCNGSISLNELLIIFKSVIIGFCRLTDQQIPNHNKLEKFAKLVKKIFLFYGKNIKKKVYILKIKLMIIRNFFNQFYKKLIIIVLKKENKKNSTHDLQ